MTRICTAARSNRRGNAWLPTRAGLPVFAAGVVLLAAGIYGAWRVHRLHSRGNAILSDNVASIRAAEELETVARELRYRIKRYLSSGSERHLEQADDLIAQGARSIDDAELLAKSKREQQLIRRIRAGYGNFRDRFARILEEPSADVRNEMASALADEVLPEELLVHTGRYIELNEQSLEYSRQRNQATANRLMFGLLLLGTCGGVMGLFAGYGIARLVNRTVVQLAIPIRDAAGKLNEVAGPVVIAAEPELKDLESVLKTVSDHVTTVVERLQESERDRLRAEQLAAVGQLAAGLAHELRNPLTSVKAILQLADQPADLSRRDLDVLQEESHRLEQSVQTLLDFARPPQPRKAEIDAYQVLEQAAHLVQRRAERQGIAITLKPPKMEARILADAVQLRQVLLNLLLNAVDVSPRGARIELECWRQKGRQKDRTHPHGNGNEPEVPCQHSQAVIRVSDSGSGLPVELGERIFEPFVTTKATGTGLGLSICRRIVESHGGSIIALSRPGGGANFEVWLPSCTRHESDRKSAAVQETPTDDAEERATVGCDHWTASSNNRPGGAYDADRRNC